MKFGIDSCGLPVRSVVGIGRPKIVPQGRWESDPLFGLGSAVPLRGGPPIRLRVAESRAATGDHSRSRAPRSSTHHRRVDFLRIRAAAILLIAGIASAACGSSTVPSSATSGPSRNVVEGISMDVRACVTIWDIVSNAQPIDAVARADSRLAFDLSTAHNPDLTSSRSHFVASETSGDYQAALKDADAMSIDCDREGIGPIVGVQPPLG
jgi:hypothetical protein